MDFDDVFHLKLVWWIQESGRQQRIIIVKDDNILVGSWLLDWS